MPMKKENLKIILCRIWSPGNVGSILRTMKNFGFNDIVSVNQMNFSDEEILTMCAGAKDHIRHLRYSEDLKSEVSDCNVVYAFTARKRRFYKVITPEEMVNEISELPENTKVGLMFGNETNGLINEETDLTDKLVVIPTEKEYSSLNIAGAVMLALYEISKRKQSESEQNEELIDVAGKEELFSLIDKVIQNKLMEKSDNKLQIRENVRHIFRRMKLNKKEAGFVRSIFEIINRKIKL
ncbi:MAG: RNA methyltransferase [Candidatus Delongbacteria bacterium]|nr:RNA methyltransferase [Candidatus Delongbacteria bacterium]MCG2760983.1 RNA methyltransferase [Candidatus Delongbacteria bacterium]